ncbi:MAG: peptidoglycan-associated lipoprotein Pal [Betaproteobacteria bacterium]|nr:peptidoglycan-associated lipoprotein Pal [Betaproteobacteria bacterium]
MKKLLVILGAVSILAGCPSAPPVKVDDAKPTTTSVPPVDTGTKPQVTNVTPTPPVPSTPRVNPLQDPSNILSKRVIYFDYDKDTVKPEFAALVQAHAKFLSENRNRRVRLEGHADERGSREYNMALGQRRADAVRKTTSVLGVSNERMETISFGEDKPKASGHDEASWAENRRVEIVYDGE